ncbi:hypothetical protein [Pradoshia sp.]
MTEYNENLNLNPSYVCEEEEEEVITLDFSNQSIYQKGEALVIKLDEECTVKEPDNSKVVNITEKVAVEPPSFQSELQTLLIDSITSKALASLLTKHRGLQDEISSLVDSKYLGELSTILDSEIDATMEKRRQEIRSCFASGIIRYDRIPAWAQSYIKEYFKDVVHEWAKSVEKE